MFNTTKYNDIIFVSNDETNMNCMPATFCMMLGRLLPSQNLNFANIVEMCDTKSGDSVWPAKILLELEKYGIESVIVESFDIESFVHEGENYLEHEFGKEAAKWQTENSDIPKEKAAYAKLLESEIHVERRVPTIEDIFEYTNNGWMVQCVVNSKMLIGKKGYVGHSVLVLDMNDDYILLHNPGLPPTPYQTVSRLKFESAWASPNQKAKNMIALRLKS